jgi:hypothetical protein
LTASIEIRFSTLIFTLAGSRVKQMKLNAINQRTQNYVSFINNDSQRKAKKVLWSNGCISSGGTIKERKPGLRDASKDANGRWYTTIGVIFQRWSFKIIWQIQWHLLHWPSSNQDRIKREVFSLKR